jgi:hypothetical protein
MSLAMMIMMMMMLMMMMTMTMIGAGGSARHSTDRRGRGEIAGFITGKSYDVSSPAPLGDGSR